MEKRPKKLLSVLLIISMLLTFLPVQAFTKEISKGVPEPQIPKKRAKPDSKIL